jgi:arsenite methyltransferase
VTDRQYLPTAAERKACCADLYASEWARLLLGESFHPGGLALTERLGRLLDLGPGARVLDVAAGTGASAIHLAKRFGWSVARVEFSPASVARAQMAANRAGVGDRVRFREGDAERLPLPDDAFGAIICECAYCTFPDKPAAAAEMARVLRLGGRLGLSDLTRSGPLPDELTTLPAWLACIADARPITEYRALLAGAGFAVEHLEAHDDALAALVRTIQARLIVAKLAVRLGKIAAPDIGFDDALRLAGSVAGIIQARRLGYALLIGSKSGQRLSARLAVAGEAPVGD